MLLPDSSRLSNLKQRYRSLPPMLRTVTLAMIIVGVVVLATPLAPGATFHLDGLELHWHDLWRTRVAFALLMLGPLMVLAGFGVLAGHPWARPVLMGFPLIQVIPFYIVHWAFGAPAPIRSVSVGTYLLLGGVWAAIAAAYLYGRPAVRRHFAGAAGST
jgi:hypothetical protein